VWCDPYVAGAVLLGLALRLTRLDNAALWFDETITAQHVSASAADMLRSLFSGEENSLPAYLLLLKGWTAGAGASEWALRFPSVAFSCATIILTAALARSWCGEGAARWAAGFAAIAPFLIHHAQEARMYALVGALSAGSLLLLSQYLGGRTRRLGVAFVLVDLLLLATHYYAAFLIAAQFVVLMVVRAKAIRAWLPEAFAVSAAALAIVLAAAFFAARNVGAVYELGLMALPGLSWSLLTGYALLPSSSELHARGAQAALAFLPVGVLGAGAFAVTAIAGLREMSHPARMLAVAVMILCTVSPVLAAAVMHIGVNPRYAMSAEPALIALLAAGAPQQSGQWVRAAAAYALVALMALATGLHLRDPGHGREDVAAAGRWLNANVPVSQEVLVTSGEMAHLAWFHWPQRRFRQFPPERVVVTAENVQRWVDAIDVPKAPGRLVFLFGRDWISDPEGLLRQRLKERYRECPGSEVRGIYILCLSASPGQRWEK
jgi:uncharacterized membrane protein